MSTSPVPPEDIRAAREHRGLAVRPRGGMLVKSIAVGAAGGALVAFLGFNHTEPAPGGPAHPSQVGTAPGGQIQLLPFFPNRIGGISTAPRVSTQP
jgi:hypothetical protein